MLTGSLLVFGSHPSRSQCWNIDLVCDNNDPTSHSWYELFQVQSLSILKALELHKFEGLARSSNVSYEAANLQLEPQY